MKNWLTEEGVTLLEGWARDGLTDEQIMHNIGCSSSTFYKWKKENSEISEALKRGKEVIDIQVENALLKSALGFQYSEEAITNIGEVVTVKRYSKPNTTAQIFWLKNRKSDTWRDKTEQEVEHKGEVSFYDDIE
ncbi:helix-turn-helix domain-containing protein [Salinicoccus albus]|uniref:helix-turn-helix domain-containing protein n=1 Tax=Salinicoccus albus TaxID=418756 RepID=UPI001FDEABBD|nr:helix-turn-helix domain-containing protein [Salinicoccus albus]